MKHFGDITKINGAEVPIVDIITGGSPCQDLSVAGKRAGLKHSDKGDEETTRSGLFMEQIRIVKEMRNECIRQLRVRGANVDFRLLKPRLMVWENVAGAFSSNKGEDFRCVLEEICRVADKTATVPMPEKGKWSTSGCIMGDGWSVAWRLHDAQFWGVPQRRKRIALVADFGGSSAPEILFERKGVSGNLEQSEQKGETTPDTIRTGIDESSTAYTLKIRGGREIDSLGHRAGKGALIQTEKSGTLGVSQDQTLIQTGSCIGFDAYNQNVTYDVSKTLTSTRIDNEHIPCVKTNTCYKKMGHAKFPGDTQKWEQTEINDTLNIYDNAETRTPSLICEKKVYENHGQDCRYKELGDVCQTVSATYGMGGNNQPLVVSDTKKLEEKNDES